MDRAAVLVWSKLSRRSRDISRRLGIKLIHLADRPPYVRAALATLKLAPQLDCMILQLPPGPALPAALLRFRGRLLCDTHTGMFHYRSRSEVILNRPFRGMLSRCDTVLAHNRDAADLLRGMVKSRVEVVYDPIPQVDRLEPVEGLQPGKFVLLPASWDPDEPISSVSREALHSLPQGMKLVITGKPRGREARLVSSHASSGQGRIVLTGFLPEPQYYWLVANAAAVIALTTWNYTVLSVVWEAAAFSRPIIASDTPTLRNLLGPDALYFNHNVRGSLASALGRLDPELGYRSASRLRRLSEESMARLEVLCST